MIPAIIIIITPKIVNHFATCKFIKLSNEDTNLKVRYEIIKNLKPLEIKLTKIKIPKLKLTNPLAMVKAL